MCPLIVSSHMSYSSIMAGNPYGKPVDTVRSKGHVPHALSENNIQYLSSHKQTHPADYYIPAYLRENEPPMLNAGSERSLSPGRGREAARTPSPSKALSDVEEESDEVLQHPENSRKRSRSPHKRLFGDNGWLTRSQSAKTLTKEEEKEAAKKGGLKQWGDKMKRRFEDLVSCIALCKSCAKWLITRRQLQLQVTRWLTGLPLPYLSIHQHKPGYMANWSSCYV